MKLISIFFLILFIFEFIKSDGVCTEEMLIRELKEDIAYNRKLDCLRVPLPPPTDHTESDEERKRRLEAVWDSDCSFEATYDWFTPLKEKFGLKNGLVDVNGKAIEKDFDDQADMCEIVRALIAGGALEGVSLDNLNEDSFNDISCPGNPRKEGICAVSGGSPNQKYSWYILLEGKGIKIGDKPNWEMTQRSVDVAKNRQYNP